MAGMAKLGEMRDGSWSIYDCFDACDLLDYRDACQSAVQKAMAKKNGGHR